MTEQKAPKWFYKTSYNPLDSNFPGARVKELRCRECRHVTSADETRCPCCNSDLLTVESVDVPVAIEGCALRIVDPTLDVPHVGDIIWES